MFLTSVRWRPQVRHCTVVTLRIYIRMKTLSNLPQRLGQKSSLKEKQFPTLHTWNVSDSTLPNQVNTHWFELGSFHTCMEQRVSALWSHTVMISNKNTFFTNFTMQNNASEFKPQCSRYR
eukprot:PhF_6_TR25640/c0_g1_i2/m.36065